MTLKLTTFTKRKGRAGGQRPKAHKQKEEKKSDCGHRRLDHLDPPSDLHPNPYLSHPTPGTGIVVGSVLRTKKRCPNQSKTIHLLACYFCSLEKKGQCVVALFPLSFVGVSTSLGPWLFCGIVIRGIFLFSSPLYLRDMLFIACTASHNGSRGSGSFFLDLDPPEKLIMEKRKASPITTTKNNNQCNPGQTRGGGIWSVTLHFFHCPRQKNERRQSRVALGRFMAHTI